MTTDHTTPDKEHIRILNGLVNGMTLQEEIRHIMDIPECPDGCKCHWCEQVEAIVILIERKRREARIEELKNIYFPGEWDFNIIRRINAVLDERIEELEREK